jgi:peroxiredoxin
MLCHAAFATSGRSMLLVALAAVVLCVGCSTGAPPQVARRDQTAAKPQPADPNGQTAAPQSHKSYYRPAGDKAGEPATIPPVFLTDAHKALCRVGVGDTMPDIQLAQLGGRRTKLADLYGKQATVVVFWKSDRGMALAELADLGPDVVEPFQSAGVAVVGIAVGDSAAQVRSAVRGAGAKFPMLLDADGAAFAKVGSDKLPRTYLLDPAGKVLWFDIEYSQATRRELAQSLQAVTGRE